MPLYSTSNWLTIGPSKCERQNEHINRTLVTILVPYKTKDYKFIYPLTPFKLQTDDIHCKSRLNIGPNQMWKAAKCIVIPSKQTKSKQRKTLVLTIITQRFATFVFGLPPWDVYACAHTCAYIQCRPWWVTIISNAHEIQGVISLTQVCVRDWCHYPDVNLRQRLSLSLTHLATATSCKKRKQCVT